MYYKNPFADFERLIDELFNERYKLNKISHFKYYILKIETYFRNRNIQIKLIK